MATKIQDDNQGDGATHLPVARPAKTDQNGKLAILGKLAQNLRESPAYSFYAFVVTLVVFCGTGFVIGGSVANMPNLLFGGLGLNGLIVIGAIVIVVTDRSRAQLPPGRDLSSGSHDPTEEEIYAAAKIENDALRQALGDINDSVLKASKVPSQTFRKAIMARLGLLRRDAARWARAEVHDAVNHRKLIIDLYRGAEVSVFSTSMQEDDAIWESAFGGDILAANQASGVPVTRVFVFPTREDVTERRMKIARAQEQAGIKVLLYIDEEDSTYDYQADLRKGFIIVDGGNVIGVTQSSYPHKLVKWTFDNESKLSHYKETMKELIAGSMSIHDFLSPSE